MLQGQVYPMYVLLESTSPKFHQFHSKTSCCWVTYHFEKSAQNDLKPYRVLHACVTSIHEAQISLRFTLQWAIFELQAILKKVHQMTPKWPWTLQAQMHPICVNSVPDPQISLHFALRPAFFEIWGILRQVHWMTSTLNPTSSNVPPYI